MLRKNVFSLLIVSLIAVCIAIGCSESEDDVNLLGSADLTQTYARIKDQLIVEDEPLVGLDAAPGAPAACPVDGNTDRFPRDRLLASYERFYADFDPVIEDSDQNYCVVVSRYKREQNYMIRVVRLNANLKNKRANNKWVRGFDTCQEAKDFRQLVLDDYNGLNQVAGTQAVSDQWTLHLFRREGSDAPHVLPHLRQQFRLDIQVVAPNGSPNPKNGYTSYDLMGYDESTTYMTQQEARDKRKELLLDYTTGSDTKQGGYIIYFFENAPGSNADVWEIKNQNSRPWIPGGRWRRITNMGEDADIFEADIAEADTGDLYVWNDTHVFECGLSTVNIDINENGLLSSTNPNEVDVDGDGVWDISDNQVILGQYRNNDGSKSGTFGDKRDIRVISLFDQDDDGFIEVSDLDNNGNDEIDQRERHIYLHGKDVFISKPNACDKVIHFEYFPKRKEGISGEIWARHRLYTWLEFDE